MERKGIIAAGNMLVDHVHQIGQWPERGWLVEIVHSERATGGAPLNVLLTLAKMHAGLPLQAVGLIGEDNDGDYITAMLDQYHINRQLVQRTSSASTSMTQVMTDAEGQRTFFHSPGANRLLDLPAFEPLDAPLKIFHLGYLLLLGSNVYEAVFGRIVTTITRHGAAPPYLLVFVFLIAGAISLKINRREQELSESRRQREVLTQLNRLKSEFLHQMAHELKTPLTVMSGYAQLTDWQLSTGAVSADAHEHMQTISSEAQRLSALVSRLIDLANGGSPDIEMGVIGAAQLLSGAVDVCRPMLEKKHNRLESDSGEGITLWGNPEMLLQVLINLTVNANRHTENGVIAYRIADEGEWVCLRVSDTGSGIAPDLLPHIFEKGCSGDGGSGIGLTICADAMKIHHGLLEVEHTDTDGTVFRLELPKKPLKTQGENDCGR